MSFVNIRHGESEAHEDYAEQGLLSSFLVYSQSWKKDIYDLTSPLLF